MPIRSKVSKVGNVVNGVGGSLTTVIPLPVRYTLGIREGERLVWEIRNTKHGKVAVVRRPGTPARAVTLKGYQGSAGDGGASE